MSRAWSLALPVLTVLVVCYALLVAGVPRKLRGARLYGGPSEGVSTLSLRVESVEREGERERAFWNGPLSVHAGPSGGPQVQVQVTQAANGVADFEVHWPRPAHGPIELELRDATGAVLASGRFALDVTRWSARARRRGGWIRGRSEHALVLSVAPERGAFVVGSVDPLAIRVERAGMPVAGATLTVSAEGARLVGGEPPRTNERGLSRVLLEATELNPTLRVEARTQDGQSGLIDTGIAVVAGGLHAVAVAEGLRIESAVPRNQAFFSSGFGSPAPGRRHDRAQSGRSRRQRWHASTPAVAHAGMASGFERGRSEQRRSDRLATRAGAGTAPPAQTFDVPDALLLDGLPAAFAREQARRSRVRWLTAAFIALAFALSVVQLVLRVRAADRNISEHLREGLAQDLTARIAPRRFLPVLVALLAIGLGFVALGLIALAR